MPAFKRSGDCVPAVSNTAPPVAVPMSAVAPLADPHPLTTEGQPEADSPADVRPFDSAQRPGLLPANSVASFSAGRSSASPYCSSHAPSCVPGAAR